MLLRLRRGERAVESVALVNSGYETRGPEVLLPLSLAEGLGLLPELPSGSVVREYVLADGSVARLIRVPDAVEVSAVEEDRVVGGVRASAAISEGVDEVLIGDKLAGALGIVALDFAEGLWCFRDELGKRERQSRA